MRLCRLALAAGLALAALSPMASAAPAERPAAVRGFDGRRVDPGLIDREARRLMAAGKVNGLAMAVIDDGRVTYVNSWGYRNVEKNLPLQTDTVMYGASITKFVFAYMVMQLVDEGRLDLDRPIHLYFDKQPWERDEYYSGLKGDPRWERLTLRMIFNHTTGFHNFGFMEPDQKLKFHFEPGSRYSYSGDGIILAQRVLEWGLKLDVEAEMTRRVWERFGMTRTSLQWRPEWNANLADGYALDGSFEPHDERSRPRAAGSMDTTIDDLAKFFAGFMRGEGLSARSRAEMIRAQIAINTATQFPILTEAVLPERRPDRLAAGLGVITFEGRYGHGWFKGGHNEWTGNQAICVEKGRRCVVLLANDVRAEGIFQRLVEATLGDPGFPWAWESYVSYDQPRPAQ